jgi:superfamily I DNA/RNA helicase
MEIYSEGPPFDALVVDEAQDFSPGWWDALDYLCDRTNPTWAFLDKAQSLRREPVDPPVEGAFRVALDINCRNTRRIVACANTATSIDSEPFELAPLGRPPKVIVPQSRAAISGLIQQELRSLLSDQRLAPNQIAILGPASKSKGPLAAVTAINGVALIDDATDWRKGNGILVTTARSFKGLEADVVILCDFSGIGNLFTVSDLYVALTRARSHLVIVAHSRAAKESLDAALAAAIAIGEDK